MPPRKKSVPTEEVAEAVEAAVTSAVSNLSEAKQTYGLKTVLVAVLFVFVLISLGVTGFFYWDLKNEYTKLEKVHRESIVSAKEEQAKAVEAEKAKIIAEYQKKIDDLLNERLKKRAAWKKKESDLSSPDRGKVIKNEIDKMDPSSVGRYFTERGFKPKLGAGGGPVSP